MDIAEKTKNLGFQVSVSKIFTVNPETMWEFILSEEGLAVWLGKISIEEFEIQKPFICPDGTEGKLTVFKPDCHIRLQFKPKHWQKYAIIELRITRIKGRAAMVIHQTNFFEEAKIEEMRSYWKGIILKIDRALME